jgi:hypothetical protein
MLISLVFNYIARLITRLCLIDATCRRASPRSMKYVCRRAEAAPVRYLGPEVVRYPNHAFAGPVRVEDGKIIRTFPSSTVSYFEITSKIISGNSGGPLLNNKHEVVGVAVRGLNGSVPLNEAEFLAINGRELDAIL